MLKWWQILLFPFAIIYDLITRFRNHLYNIGVKRAFEFEVNVIGVGNLSVGGTGKTPMVDYLIKHFLQKGMKVATLSRGYGRKTKGFRICTENDSPKTVGDEPFTYFEQYKSQLVVAVGEERALAIPFILGEHPEIELILLDDAFQHRSVKPNFNILLTTFDKPFWRDFILPSGRLREGRYGYKRADAIIVTKSDQKISDPFLSKTGKPNFQTTVTYGTPIPLFGEMPHKKVIVVAGLANNSPFFQYVNSIFEVSNEFSFPDHHFYSEKDVARLEQYLEGGVSLITTQKDAVKLRGFDSLKKFNCAFIPIQVRFLEEEEHFLQMVDECIQDYQSNH
jgi:tetraacyldisaccharide 4'-kinase